MINEENIKLIFGLKINLLRQERGLSSAELAEMTGLSASYINEIEKGKKYPKADKITVLAQALGVTYDHLVSLQLNQQLEPLSELMQSNLLSNLPLRVFGLEPRHFIELVSSAPGRIGSFINTLMKIARTYNLTVENFYLTALRSYQELHDNYFDDIEAKALAFRQEIHSVGKIPLEKLKQYLAGRYGYVFDYEGMNDYTELRNLRTALRSGDKFNRLYINKNLSEGQQVFALCREVGYHLLGLKERSYTYSWMESATFDELINDFKATYFAGAVILQKEEMLADLNYFFNLPTWQPERLLEMIDRHEVSVEMYMHRVTNLTPRYFGLKNIFFLRFNNDPGTDRYYLSKELHLGRLHNPHQGLMNERYCRRWVSLTSLKELELLLAREGQHKSSRICSAQRSSYHESHNEYFCITLARPSYMPHFSLTSVTVGFLTDDMFMQRVKFWNDPQVRRRIVNETCERCSMADCAERAAEPVFIRKKMEEDRFKAQIHRLLDGQKSHA